MKLNPLQTGALTERRIKPHPTQRRIRIGRHGAVGSGENLTIENIGIEAPHSYKPLMAILTGGVFKFCSYIQVCHPDADNLPCMTVDSIDLIGSIFRSEEH